MMHVTCTCTLCSSEHKAIKVMAVTLSNLNRIFQNSVTTVPQQLSKINTCSLLSTHSARNLGFTFDEHLTFSDQISAPAAPPSYAYDCITTG